MHLKYYRPTSSFDIGLADYVSEPGTTAVDKALEVAQKISVNGDPIFYVFYVHWLTIRVKPHWL